MECGSPGRIRTSDMTVNSRPLYRLSYRGVFFKPLLREASEILLLASYRREIKRLEPAIISGKYAYESIVRLGLFGSAERFVLHRAHRLYCLGDIFRGQHSCQAREDRVGVERGVGLENAP
jgi:hypothetical protein